MKDEKILIKQKKIILNAFLFEFAPEFFESYRYANKDEKQKILENNKQFLTKYLTK